MPTPERVLRNTQKADLYSYLHSKGLSPEDFILTETHPSVHLRHRFSDYGCIITVGTFSIVGFGDAVFSLLHSPGRERLREEEFFHTWDSLLAGFDDWLTCLTGELKIPDLWATISGDTQLIKLAADQDNRPFTPDDQLQFKKALDEIKTYLIKSHNLTGARLETVEGRLSYLEEAATRMGRKDVIHIAIGVLANIATGLLLDADGTRELFRFAGQIFKQLLGNVYYLVGPH
jgi:hypothetical protein